MELSKFTLILSVWFNTLLLLWPAAVFLSPQPPSKRRWNCWLRKHHNCKSTQIHTTENDHFALCPLSVIHCSLLFYGSITTQWECSLDRTLRQCGWAGSHLTITTTARTSASARRGRSPSRWETRGAGFTRGKLLDFFNIWRKAWDIKRGRVSRMLWVLWGNWAVSGNFQPHSNSGKVIQYCLRASVWIKFSTEPLRTLCEICLQFPSFLFLASLLSHHTNEHSSQNFSFC